MTTPTPMSANPNIPVEEMTYEQAFKALEETAAVLEAGQLSLDQAMQQFERGQALLRHCMKLLEQAELRVRQLSGEELTDFTPQA
jgi:exodeoxyribonuclease VII small subunit